MAEQNSHDTYYSPESSASFGRVDDAYRVVKFDGEISNFMK